MAPTIRTVKEKIAWSYANLARAHSALDDGAIAYNRTHHIVRSRLFCGLMDGRMSMRSLYDDERIKLTVDQACSYCGSPNHLVIDHLIPRIKGGPDDADNLILACRSCNSSKGGRDMMDWLRGKGNFPSILLLRRYLKIVARYCERQGIMEAELVSAASFDLPFELSHLPEKFPPLPELKMWARAAASQINTSP